LDITLKELHEYTILMSTRHCTESFGFIQGLDLEKQSFPARKKRTPARATVARMCDQTPHPTGEVVGILQLGMIQSADHSSTCNRFKMFSCARRPAKCHVNTPSVRGRQRPAQLPVSATPCIGGSKCTGSGNPATHPHGH